MEKMKTGVDLIRRPIRLGDEVYNAIYAQLMSLRIAPGGRLSVDNLVRELGVSQTPIREALSRLEAQGLVTKTHLVGYSAANQMDRSRLEQLYQLRLLLEPFAAAKAAEKMSEEMLANVIRIGQEMREPASAEPREAYARFARMDSEFHDLIALGSGNELVQEALSRLHIHVHLFRLYFHSLVTAAAIDEHDRLVSALQERNAVEAEAAMREHILRSRDRFIQAAV
jgi:DNA-binding GntR family transcriptional regulator